MQTPLGLPDGLPGIVMAIHTFGEYMDFHPHLHALVADGLFVRSGLFYVLPDVSPTPLEELFRARLLTFLAPKGPAATALDAADVDTLRVHRASQPPRPARRARRPGSGCPGHDPQPVCRREDAGPRGERVQSRRLRPLPFRQTPEDPAHRRGCHSLRRHRRPHSAYARHACPARPVRGSGTANTMRGDQRDTQSASRGSRRSARPWRWSMSRKHHPRRIPLGDMACKHHDSLGRGSSCSVRRVNGTGGSSRSVRTGRSSSPGSMTLPG